ncbi:MAG: efflux RND transporter periplasmic adaptor subunit [Phycisphaerales bacterium]|nr:efflux RND transporter periplasmic adaptor subunit [Phycisphaerales bacterium]
MAQHIIELPRRHAALRLQPSGPKGRPVAKNTSTGEYFALGEQEAFLLEGFNGSHTFDTLQSAFERRFQRTLTEDDLRQFIGLASSSGLLERDPSVDRSVPGTDRRADSARTEPCAARRRPQNSILFWRRSLLDPDRILSVIEPRIRVVWSRWFVLVTAMAIVLAVFVAWSSRLELVSRFPNAFSWNMVVLAWLTLVVCTASHEFAHGLTCKHYGGEVREIGVLVLFFTPCFYCNVSDAWLLGEKSKRLAVTFAGAYCDLVLWAAAVLVWRVTLQDSAVNYLAWIVLSVCGARVFFNFNPLLKLDGYYLLSDLLEIPNLRQRGWDAMTARMRRLLWGAPKRKAAHGEGFLLAFGIASWLFSLAFLSIVLLGLIEFFGARWGIVGFAGVCFFGVMAMRGLLTGFFSGEVRNMIRFRPFHTAFWFLALGGAGAALSLVEVDHARGGPFVVRSLVRAELQAPIDGFLRDVEFDEGARLEEGQIIGRVEVRDLESQTLQKRNDIDEAKAKVRGCEMELEYANDDRARADLMLKGDVMSPVEHRNAEKRRRACEAELQQARARLARLEEELAYLSNLALKTIVRSPIAGVIMTPHLREKDGLFFEEGDSLCVIEDLAALEIEITLSEEDVGPVCIGQAVQLKARAFPYQTFGGTVQSIAPGVVLGAPGDTQGRVIISCRLDNSSHDFRSGMTGHARIMCGRQKLGKAIFERALAFVRTEFWW